MLFKSEKVLKGQNIFKNSKFLKIKIPFKFFFISKFHSLILFFCGVMRLMSGIE